jgi:hypothetical protein
LYNLWGLMQNENAGPFAQKLRISWQGQQSIQAQSSSEHRALYVTVQVAHP